MLKKYIVITTLLSVLLNSNFLYAQENQPKSNFNITDPISKKYGFTIQEEKEIGLQSSILLTKRYGFLKNNTVNNYINKIGKNIAKTISKRPDITYNFFVLDTLEINAFALPGGYIFITKGALKIIENEAELAGVLAHEISHIEEGHGLESIAANPKLREKLNLIKVNVSEGKGYSQKNLRSILAREKNITSGIVNTGSVNILQNTEIKVNKDGSIVIE